MKKIFLFILSAAVLSLAVASCERQGVDPVRSDEAAPDEIEVTFGIPSIEADIETRAATASSNESTVNQVTFILFKSSDNSLYKWGSANANSVALKVAPDTYKVYAIVNKTFSVTAETTVSNVTSMVSTLSDNSSTNFVMSGMETKTIAANTTTCVVAVTRHCAKVVVNKISVNFDGSELDGKSLRIDKVYIENAWMRTKFGPTNVTPNTTASYWANLWGYTSNTAVNALLSDVVTGVTIADNASDATNKHFFYPYPNPTTTATPGSGTDIRCSRLVIEATVMDGSTAGTTYFYHVDIPNIQSNKVYTVNDIVIKNAGGPDPEHNNDMASVTFSVSVNNWTEGWTQDSIEF